MRNKLLLIIAFWSPFTVSHGQERFSQKVEHEGYAITAVGAHHRVWSRLTLTTNSSGAVSRQTNSFVQLATGLNRWDGKDWVESRPELVETPNGISARGAQHTAHFDENINSRGSVQIKMSDGGWLKGHPLCLGYYDSST